MSSGGRILRWRIISCCLRRHMLRSPTSAILLCILALFSEGAVKPAQAGANPIPPADVQIASALRQVSAERVQADIETLVSFQTRSPLSAQDEQSVRSGHGIGAAREWIKAEFERYSRDCGRCLEVKTDTFREEPGERIPKPT